MLHMTSRVIKRHDRGLKVRVVFNPAEKDTNRTGFNDYAISKPKLQSNVGLLTTKFRFFKIAFHCDICQIFRCIEIHPDDRKYFRVFWKFYESGIITEWQHWRAIFVATSTPSFFAYLTVSRWWWIQLSLCSKAFGDSRLIDDTLSGAETEEVVPLLSRLLYSRQLGKFPSCHCKKCHWYFSISPQDRRFTIFMDWFGLYLQTVLNISENKLNISHYLDMTGFFAFMYE